MKLIDFDKLQKLFKERYRSNWLELLTDEIDEHCQVDPAELDLAAVRVLDKIRKSPVIKAYSDVCAYIDAVVSAADLKVPAKPEDVTVILSKVLDIIEEEGEMVPGRGAPNKIAVRPLLDSLDGLDRYPVPQEDKPDYKAMIEDLEIDFNGVYAFQLAARSARLKDILKKVRAEHTPVSRETDVREKPEGKDGKQDELRSQRKPPTDCPPEKEKR